MVPVQNSDLRTSFTPWFTDLRLHGTEYSGAWPNYKNFSALPWANTNNNIAKFLERDAPWRTMQIQEPPIITLIIEIRHNDRGADMVIRTTLSFPKGLRMATLYDLTWTHCAKVDTVFGVRWDGIPLPDGNEGIITPGSEYEIRKWRSQTFLPKLGGEQQIVLELYHGQTWFMQNYKSGMELPDNSVIGWERFMSEGMGEGDQGEIMEKENIPEQVFRDEL
jgi:hypothetical protein